LQAPQGLQGLQAWASATTIGVSPAEAEEGANAAPAAMVTTVTATTVSLIISQFLLFMVDQMLDFLRAAWGGQPAQTNRDNGRLQERKERAAPPVSR
jgi:hypothetical protein